MRFASRSASESDSDAKIPSKDDVDPSSKESTRSATHDEIARNSDVAFNPGKTNPVDEKTTAGAEVCDQFSSAGAGTDALTIPGVTDMFVAGFWL